jgi:hypothetical protein
MHDATLNRTTNGTARAMSRLDFRIANRGQQEGQEAESGADNLQSTKLVGVKAYRGP